MSLVDLTQSGKIQASLFKNIVILYEAVSLLALNREI
jgi:hypothetical protein